MVERTEAIGTIVDFEISWPDLEELAEHQTPRWPAGNPIGSIEIVDVESKNDDPS